MNIEESKLPEKLQVIKDDPYLQPFEKDLILRQECFQK